MSTLLCARAASAHVSALRRAPLLDEVQRKTLRPLGANPLTQFVSPGQMEPGREPPRQGVAHTRLVRPAKPLQKAKEKPLTFVSGLLVEVTGLEPVTLCRLADDEPSRNRKKKKHLLS